jgi:transcriptional regulator GlxA family with amidase domain
LACASGGERTGCREDRRPSHIAGREQQGRQFMVHRNHQRFRVSGSISLRPVDPTMQAAEDKFGALHDWINGHLGDDLPLSVLADQAGMSERSFSRHYAEATGQTPARAIERLRVEAARRLLSESRLSVKRVAQRCGFGSEETMRRGFLRLLAVTPQDYRSRFTF